MFFLQFFANTFPGLAENIAPAFTSQKILRIDVFLSARYDAVTSRK